MDEANAENEKQKGREKDRLMLSQPLQEQRGEREKKKRMVRSRCAR